MSNQNVFSTLMVTWVALPSLAMFLATGSAKAQNSSAQYTFLVASGLLCNPDDSATCPVVVKVGKRRHLRDERCGNVRRARQVGHSRRNFCPQVLGWNRARDGCLDREPTH